MTTDPKIKDSVEVATRVKKEPAHAEESLKTEWGYTLPNDYICDRNTCEHFIKLARGAVCDQPGCTAKKKGL